METVSKFWSGQYNDGNEVADEAKTANDADEEAIAVVLEVDHGGVVGEVRTTVSGQSSTDIKCPIEHVMLTSPPEGWIKTVTFQALLSTLKARQGKFIVIASGNN